MLEYSDYDPQQTRDAAYQRLRDLSSARQRFTDEMFRRAEEERMKNEKHQLSQMRDNMGSVWGTVGHMASLGAGIGSIVGAAGGPIGVGAGAGIGAVGGLLLGTGMEIYNRKKFENEYAGRKNYDKKDAFTDTFSRMPNMGEFTSLLGAGAAVTQGLAHGPGGSAGAAQQAHQAGLAKWQNQVNAASSPGSIAAPPGSVNGVMPTTVNVGNGTTATIINDDAWTGQPSQSVSTDASMNPGYDEWLRQQRLNGLYGGSGY